jgi:signal transduction histidine kinase
MPAAEMINPGDGDFSEENRLRIELREAHEALENEVADRLRFDRAVIMTMDRERHRMAGLLHGTACQSLNGIGLLSQVILRKLARTGVVDASDITELGQAIKGATREIYWVAREIRPPTEIDEIASALARAVEPVAPSLLCEVDCAEEVRIECQFTAEQLVQIAHEGVSEAARRPGVTRIHVALAIQGRQVTLTVTDDGHADDTGPGSGLDGLDQLDLMRLRARVIGASLDCSFQENQGSTLTCMLPQPP